MRIKLELFGLHRIDRFKEDIREYPDTYRAKDIIEDLGLPRQHVGAVAVNGIHAPLEHKLHDGDCLMILPLMGGG